MGVKLQEELLIKAAWMFGNYQLEKKQLLKAAELYAKAKQKARNNRDKWKMRKRLSQ